MEKDIKKEISKEEEFKGDSIIIKLNEIKKINTKGKTLLFKCLNLKYNNDVQFNPLYHNIKPFVFNYNIGYVDFTDDYIKAVNSLEKFVVKCTYLYNYIDIVNNESFSSVLEECLANYFILYAEYCTLMCNIQDYADHNCIINEYDKSSEIKDIMLKVSQTINSSTWKNLPYCEYLD